MTEGPNQQDDLHPLLEAELLGFEGAGAKPSEDELVAAMRTFRNRRLRLWAPVGAASLVLAGLLGSALTDGSATLTNVTSSSSPRCSTLCRTRSPVTTPTRPLPLVHPSLDRGEATTRP